MIKPSSNVELVEVLTQPEQRRRRSVEEKLAIVRETFVKTMKRDYVSWMPKPDARTAL
jgi:hypothetical protein